MGLQRDIVEQPITELEWRPLITVTPSDTVRHAVALMRQESVGGVVVVADDGKVIGQFTDRDLIRLLLDHTDPLDEQIDQHMCRTWGQVSQTDPIKVTIDQMQDSKLRYGIVMDEASRPVGLTGQKGVMEYIAEHFPRQVKVQMMKSKLHMDEREGG